MFKKPCFVILNIIFLFYLSQSQVFATITNISRTKVKETETFAPNQVIVTFKDTTGVITSSRSKGSIEELGKIYTSEDLGLNQRSNSPLISINQQFKIKELQSLNSIGSATRNVGNNAGTYVITFEQGNVPEQVEYLENTGLFESVTPNYIVTAAAIPNDPYYNNLNRDPNWNPPYEYQWNLKRIDMQHAWDLTGNELVFVAVIDTGIDYTHQEFGSCTLDSTKNGSCNTVFSGYDFHNNDNDPMDDNLHGTHVAGTINALTNNGVGIAGISPNAVIVPFKALGSTGSGYISNFILAVQSTIDFQDQLRAKGFNNRVVINMSLTYNVVVNEMIPALTTAYNKGIVVVAAAGNENTNAQNTYPAAITCSENIPVGQDCVITVSAVDENDVKSEYSNYGQFLDISAPGGSNDNNVLSLKTKYLPSYYDIVVNNNYLRISGTSMATPHVSAVASMILGVNPDLTVKQVQDILYDGVDLKTPYSDFGRGRLNAYKSMKLAVATRNNIKDYDNNGVVNNADLLLLAKYVLHNPVTITNPNAVLDLNNDSKVNLQDVVSFL
jgi:subtilisin family serine protease